MINQIKTEVERRTGLPPAVVDQVITALGEIIAQQYPQYAAFIGPILGINMSSTPGQGTGLPSIPGLTSPAPGSGTTTTPATPGGTDLGSELTNLVHDFTGMSGPAPSGGTSSDPPNLGGTHGGTP